jgi:hypothetical protein
VTVASAITAPTTTTPTAKTTTTTTTQTTQPQPGGQPLGPAAITPVALVVGTLGSHHNYTSSNFRDSYQERKMVALVNTY